MLHVQQQQQADTFPVSSVSLIWQLNYAHRLITMSYRRNLQHRQQCRCGVLNKSITKSCWKRSWCDRSIDQWSLITLEKVKFPFQCNVSSSQIPAFCVWYFGHLLQIQFIDCAIKNIDLLTSIPAPQPAFFQVIVRWPGLGQLLVIILFLLRLWPQGHIIILHCFAFWRPQKVVRRMRSN